MYEQRTRTKVVGGQTFKVIRRVRPKPTEQQVENAKRERTGGMPKYLQKYFFHQAQEARKFVWWK